jgi:hypothetical protein
VPTTRITIFHAVNQVIYPAINQAVVRFLGRRRPPTSRRLQTPKPPQFFVAAFFVIFILPQPPQDPGAAEGAAAEVRFIPNFIPR